MCFGQIAGPQSDRNRVDFDLLKTPSDQGEHLDYEQLERYVDEKSGEIEREIADVHLQVCAGCTAELNGLVEMRGLIETDAARPAPTKKGKSIFALVQNFFSGRHKLRLAFAALLVFVLFAGIYRFFLRDRSNEVAVISPNTNLPENRPNPPDNSAPNVNSLPPNNINSETNNATNLAAPTPTPGEIEPVPPRFQSEIERVAANGRLEIPQELSQLNNQTGKLMGGGTDEIPFALSSPVGKIILSNRPRFNWKALGGAKRMSSSL